MDTYFFDYKEAYKEARKQNKSTIFNDLQICYYNGEHKESPYPNLIGVPIDSFCDYFSETPNRMVNQLICDNNFNDEQKLQIESYLKQLQQLAIYKKLQIGNQYRELIKNQEPDFTEPLRILFITTRCTTVLQYVAKNLADAFNDLGYSTFISIEENAMQSWGGNDSHGNAEFAWHLKNIYEYNPHIIFNLDWINNTFLNEKVFNFVWFQDDMDILYDNEKINLRERDYIFSLFDEFKNALIKKGVTKSKIINQQFATNPKIFYRNNTIEKEDKIVFLGGNYGFDKQLQNVQIRELLSDEVLKMIDKGHFDTKKLKSLSEQYDIPLTWIINRLVVSLVRLEVVKWLCAQKKLLVEVYGSNHWLDVPEVAPFYKGLLPYGEEMAKVYNSAKYAISAHPQYRYQQRVFEISACGTIPVVYKCNLMQEKFYHEDNILSFSTFDELLECIGKEPIKSPKQISEDISYEKMAIKIIDIVRQNVR